MDLLTNTFCGTILTVAVVLLALVFAYFSWAFYYWKRRGVTHPPPSIPFGNFSRAIFRKTTFGGIFKEIYDTYKGQGLRYVGIYIFAKPVLVVLDINLVRAILTTDFHHFTDRGNYINEVREPLTGNLFALKGQKWRNLRIKLTPTFTSGKMKMMFHTLLECSKGLKDIMDDMIKKREVVDIKDTVARYTTDVIGSCAFGLDCNSLKDPESQFRKFGRRIVELDIYQALVRFLSIGSPKVLDTFGLKFIRQDVNDFFINVVTETVNYRETNNVQRTDFMHLLIQLKNNVQIKDASVEHVKNKENTESGDGLTINQIAAQVLIFFIGGFETSSTTLSFCLYELAINKAVQEKLRAEVHAVLKKHKNSLSYDAIMEMTYMDKCVQETLRKYPPVPFLIRECTQDYTIPDSGLTIEKGTCVFIPTLGIHGDPEYYPGPEIFDPERFSADTKASRHVFAWLPFGEGPRICIGLRFGIMQTKVALAVLLKDYEFTLNDKTMSPIVISPGSFILSAKGGIWLNVKNV